METQNEMTKRQKAWKITSLVINIVSIIIMLFAIFIVVSSLVSKDKGYTVYFGKAYAVVQSDSMAEDLTKWDNFQKGDVIAFKVLSDQDKDNLKVGDVITFWDHNLAATDVLNTHRIVEIQIVDGKKQFITQGDNHEICPGPDASPRTLSDVQGVYAGKSPFFGRILTFLQSKTGFAVFIVVPCVLIVIYCLTLVVMNLMKYAKSKAVLQHEDDVDKLKAELKAQLLKEMEENKGKKKEPNTESETKDDDKKEEKEKPEKKSKVKEKNDDAKVEEQESKQENKESE